MRVGGLTKTYDELYGDKCVEVEVIIPLFNLLIWSSEKIFSSSRSPSDLLISGVHESINLNMTT